MIKVRIAKTDKLGCDLSIFVSFPYDNRVLEIVRSFPQKWWHAEDKEWELPLNKLQPLTQKLSNQVFDITAEEYVDLTNKQGIQICHLVSIYRCFRLTNQKRSN